MFAASSASAQLEDDRAATAIWKLEIFWWQAELEGDRATTAIWELEIFGGRPSWKATGLQLQPGNSRFLGAGPVGRRQGYNCNLGTRDFWWQAQFEGDRATTAIWDLEIFWWQAQLKGERATTAIWELEIFWWQAQLEGDRATTAIWELEIFWWQVLSCCTATGLLLQSGNSTFFGWQAQLENDRATTGI